MKKRVLRIGLVLLALATAAWLYGKAVSFLGFGFPCVFYELTGLQCPGCGLTRAVLALARGEFASATQYNPMIWLYLAYGTWYGLWGSIRYIRGIRNPYEFGPAWIHWGMLGAVLVFAVVRNFL